MKRLLLTTSLAATLLLASAAAFADNDGGHDKHKPKHDGDGHGYYDDRDHDDRYDNHDNGRHLGQVKHGYRRGERVPVIYLQPRYYVEDYRVYHLAPPPRGYRWVRPQDDRYLLVEAATGLISQALGY